MHLRRLGWSMAFIAAVMFAAATPRSGAAQPNALYRVQDSQHPNNPNNPNGPNGPNNPGPERGTTLSRRKQ